MSEEKEEKEEKEKKKCQIIKPLNQSSPHSHTHFHPSRLHFFPAPTIPFIPSTAPCPYPPSGPWLSTGRPWSSLPPRSARLMPSFEMASPSGCARPPWPICPLTRLLTPSCAVSICSLPVSLVLSRFSGGCEWVDGCEERVGVG